jgi:hypothetical protein
MKEALERRAGERVLEELLRVRAQRRLRPRRHPRGECDVADQRVIFALDDRAVDVVRNQDGFAFWWKQID